MIYRKNFSDILYRDLGLYKIPVLNLEQATQFGKSSFNDVIPQRYIYTDYKASEPEAIFAVVVTDNTMESDFKENDTLIIDENLLPKPGSFVIATYSPNSSAVFRKYKAISYDWENHEIFELVALNDDFPIISSKNQKIHLIGCMVRHIRDFKY